MQKSAIQSRKSAFSGSVTVNYRKGAICFRKVPKMIKKYQKSAGRCDPNQKKCHPKSSCLVWKSCHPFKESAIDNEKNIIQCRVCRKVLSKAEKMPSKEELLFKMEKVPYVSNKCNWHWKISQKCRKLPSKVEKML